MASSLLSVCVDKGESFSPSKPQSARHLRKRNRLYKLHGRWRYALFRERLEKIKVSWSPLATLVFVMVLLCAPWRFGLLHQYMTAGDALEPGSMRSLLATPAVQDCSKCGSDFEQNYTGLASVTWIIIVFYCFCGLAVICDEYFVASLEEISERLNLSEDVAGATFMASASSAPELFTSLADTFGEAECSENIGVGTIVGSAMFNILVIIAAAGVFSGGMLKIDWRPLVRDSSFYLVSIVLLLVFFVNETGKQIKWWEGLIMLSGYVVYVLFMWKNQKILSRCCPREEDKLALEAEQALEAVELTGGILSSNDVVLAESGPTVPQTPKMRFRGVVRAVMIANRMPKLSEEQNNYRQELEKMDPNVRTETEIKNALIAVPVRARTRSSFMALSTDPQAIAAYAKRHHLGGSGIPTPREEDEEGVEQEGNIDDNNTEGDEEEEEDSICGPTFGKVMGVVAWPVAFALKLTVPDCTKPGLERFFMVTFALSIVWIGVFSWFMVQFAAALGCMWGISEVLMGVTVLAMGTSVPDALGSVVAARQGAGSMAVSNAIGSNVFDILIGLGFPWFLSGLVYGKPVIVNDCGLVVPILILLGTVFVCTGILAAYKWRLSRGVGALYMILYAGYVTYSVVADAVSKDRLEFPEGVDMCLSNAPGADITPVVPFHDNHSWDDYQCECQVLLLQREIPFSF